MDELALNLPKADSAAEPQPSLSAEVQRLEKELAERSKDHQNLEAAEGRIGELEDVFELLKNEGAVLESDLKLARSILDQVNEWVKGHPRKVLSMPADLKRAIFDQAVRVRPPPVF